MGMIRYIYLKMRNTAFGEKYLVDGAVINFLRRTKHFLGRVKRKMVSMFPKQQKYENILSVMRDNLCLDCQNTTPDDTEIDVIVPIYNGYDYLVRLFECLLKTDMKCRIILVDDKSSDERVQQLEKSFALQHDNVILLQNEENLGFVGTVNHGLSIAKNHVALVNTDTELPYGWLERLMYPVLHEEKVASTTPYTNSGTICSFPEFGYNNQIYRGKSVDIIDKHFQKIKPKYVSLPTGVGFCMGMNRQAIDEVGVLDYEAFGRGFGEENDWCQRAIKKGYRNVQVENLFVYHKHGGTFLSEEKEKLIEDHMQIIRKRYPTYDYQVGTILKKDPNKKIRQIAQMLIDSHETKSILYFDHSLGGGATSYLNVKKEEFLTKPCCVSVVRFSIDRNNYRFSFENGRECLEYEFENITDILEIGKWLHFDEIYINELVTYPKLWNVHNCLLQLKEQQNSQLIMLFHDFFAVCPTINLMNNAQEYCGMPSEEICERCYSQKGFAGEYECKTRREWVEHWREFLQRCTEVRTFSEDTYQRVHAAYGDGLKLTLVGHQVNYAFPIHKETKTTKTLNIGILGVLAIHKGSNFIAELLDEIEKQKLDVKVKLIGDTEKVDFGRYSNFEKTGPYAPSDLPQLIYENDIDIFLISSVWPETFSYTTEEVIKMGMPIAAFDLGAPAERIRRYDKGLILKERNAKSVLEEICRFTNEELELPKTVVNYKKIVYIAEYISFSSRYRIEHMKEELLYQGVEGEIWKTSSLPKKICWDEIGTMVIYRCRYQEPLKQLIAEAKKNGIRLVYDIDDYIFDYQEIRDLPFMQNREYRDFETYSHFIYECMKVCDDIVVSTNHLKMGAEKVFPQKHIYVNRNVASTKMLILSVIAQRRKRSNEGLVLGYFSGSNTHSRDFELISDVILEFMQRHEEVYLKVVGCLELPKGFERIKERIINIGFLDWRKLPDEIGTVDINLMPLEDSFFHACKSENKWMEAALVKVVTIGSYNKEIAEATRPGENILLCKNREEWISNMELLRDPEFRQNMAQSAFEYVVEHKTTLKKNRELMEFVVENK